MMQFSPNLQFFFWMSSLSRTFFKTKNLCSQSFCDHIQWFQWLQVVIPHGYVTLVWSHMHWISQKCLEVLIRGTNVMYNFSVRPLYNSSSRLIGFLGYLVLRLMLNVRVLVLQIAVRETFTNVFPLSYIQFSNFNCNKLRRVMTGYKIPLNMEEDSWWGVKISLS